MFERIFKRGPQVVALFTCDTLRCRYFGRRIEVQIDAIRAWDVDKRDSVFGIVGLPARLICDCGKALRALDNKANEETLTNLKPIQT